MATISEDKELEELRMRLAQLKALRAQELERMAQASGYPRELDEQRPSGMEMAMAIGGDQIIPTSGGKSQIGAPPRAMQEGAIEGVGSTLGAAVGALPVFSIPTGGASIPAGMALGGAGASVINQMRRGGPISVGEVFGSAVSNLFSAGRVAGTGVKALATEAGKQGAANLAGTTTEAAFEGRLPTFGEAGVSVGAGAAGAALYRGVARETKALAEETRKAQRTYRDQLMKLGKEVGFVFDPVKSNPTLTTQLVTMTSYPAEFYRKAADANQEVVNKLTRAELGLPVDADLGNPLTLANALVTAKEPYRQVAALSPTAKLALEKWQLAREDARDFWNDYARNAGVKEKKAAIAAEQRIATAERVLEREAQKAGRPELTLGLQEAKVKLAKLHQVEVARHKATGDIDPQALAKVHDAHPNLFTGNLKLIAEIASIQKHMFRDASDLRGALSDTMGGLSGGMNATVGEGLRKLQMSRPYQATFGIPRYNTGVQDPVGTFLMRGTQAVGR